MNEPNQPSKADIIAAREIAKSRTHPAHGGDIDAGKWDAYGAVQSALAELIRQRTDEGEGE